MQTTLIAHPRLHVEIITGREGPRHDPYSYTECVVTTPDIKVLVHSGLAVFAVIGTQRVEAHGKDYDDPKWVDRIMKESVGYSVSQFERFSRKAKARCPAGGKHDLMTVNGMLGESFEYCEKCGKYVDSFFCIEAVI